MIQRVISSRDDIIISFPTGGLREVRKDSSTSHKHNYVHVATYLQCKLFKAMVSFFMEDGSQTTSHVRMIFKAFSWWMKYRFFKSIFMVDEIAKDVFSIPKRTFSWSVEEDCEHNGDRFFQSVLLFFLFVRLSILLPASFGVNASEKVGFGEATGVCFGHHNF